MTDGWIRPIADGWVVRDEVPGPDVDEFAEPARIVDALRRRHTDTLLAVQHPHRTPAAMARGLGLLDALPTARATLSVLLRTAYRPVRNVVAPYEVDGPDGTAVGVLCMVDPAAVDAEGLERVRHGEQVYPEIVAERAEVLAGLGHATSAAMLVPVGERDTLTGAVRTAVAGQDPVVSTIDSAGRRHRLWLLPDGDGVLAEASTHPLMVADGNHRVAAAATAGLTGLLALVTAGPDLRIGAFHRVLTGTGHTAATLTEAWRRAGLPVTDTDAVTDAEPAHGSTVVHTPHGTFTVRLPRTGQDHAVVEETLLRDALGLDPEGPHVHPLPAGRRPPTDADAVLHLAPVPLADVKAVHAAGRRMPRKSTYFTPKPRSGLLLARL
ncbi:DUF1015 family protein [Actinophytocola gossypii]|uniref:DUF1015 family protein n=1 Tax=Actinophytocola gossypii TaxID=2812003 RepID=A0ABT2JIA6_9PSEU|nr:DUF1015 family protein [Actinophytocola gossypii]MCT2587609.1 DUF1015 family protein [Actinophytocola gossypii]